jgi:hypothetical protein
MYYCTLQQFAPVTDWTKIFLGVRKRWSTSNPEYPLKNKKNKPIS